MASGSSNPAYEIVKHIIDIEDEPEHLNITKWSIYKVPRNLRNLESKEPAYTPQLVSIGPLHYDQKELKPMRKHKLRYLDLFRRRLENNIEPLDKFKDYLRRKKDRIRGCYAEKIDNDNHNHNHNDCDPDEKLVEMMFLDSVFIMELFLRVQRQKSEDGGEKKKCDSDDDIILKQSWLNKCIQRDLLLLENQIPWFILKKLYKNFVPASDAAKKEHPTFVGLARGYFNSLLTYDKCDEESGRSDFKGEPLNNKPKHFTDLIRSFYICKRELGVSFKKVITTKFNTCFDHVSNVTKKSPLKTAKSPLKTATKLRESGVSFEKVKTGPLLDIKFRRVPILSWFLCFGCIPNSLCFKARLLIPELKVDYTTECVLKNLIAFEQCHYPNKPYICNYVSFIDSLIHTKDDVELLVENEVIVHELGSDKEVATLVNGLCKHVVANETCYGDLINDLNKHYQTMWNRAMAALMLVYFRDTWRASSTVAAIVVLVFTIFNFWRVVRLVFDLEGGYKKP